MSAFRAQNVKYLIVGGYTVSFHGQPRATKDIDVFIKADITNAMAAYAALASFGAPLQDLTVEDLADSRQFMRFGREPVAVDILPRVDGVIDVGSGLKAFFISKEDLILSKIAAGWLRDLADVEDLREAGRSAENESDGDRKL